MNKSLFTAWLSSLLVSLTLFIPTSLRAEEGSYFISENLFTYLHSGPGKQFRIIGSVSSGSPVTFKAISEDKNYAQIIDNKGREGWIEAKGLAQGQTRKQQIERLEQQIEGLSAQLQQEQQSVRQALANIEQLEQELSQSQQAMVQTTQERDAIQQELSGYADETQMKWFINGGMVAGGGVLLGLILSLVSRKKKRSDHWM